MASLSLVRNYSLGGLVHSESQSIDLTGAVGVEVLDIPAAKTGALTTRTDNDTGTLTMTAGHGITNGQKLDVYWSGGCRRNMTVGTVATNSVPIDGGSGDNLPVVSTAITAMVPTVKDLLLIGDNLLALIGSATAPAIIAIQESDGTDRFGIVISEANKTYGWLSEDRTVTNPLATYTTEKVAVSHGDSSGAKTVRVSAGY